MTAETIAQTAFRKIIWRLMPLLTVSYILNYLDRGNIGFADQLVPAASEQEVGWSVRTPFPPDRDAGSAAR